MNIHFIQHASFEHPGYLLVWAQQKQHNISITKIFDEVNFPSLEEIELLVVMGGPMGVYEEDKYPWLKAEKQFINNCIKADKKVLGICLGSQLVAEVLGAKVSLNKEKEIGWWPIKKTDNQKENILLKDLPDEFITFHWHGDTFEIPDGATHLLSSEACTNQGFLYGNKVGGLQFHMEVMDDLLHDMTLHEKAELVESKFVQSEADIHSRIKNYVQLQNVYMNHFIEAFVNL